MSRLEVSNRAEVARLTALANDLGSLAKSRRQRALVVLQPPESAILRAFAALQAVPFIAATDTADRSDRVTRLLGSEFGMLVHETHDPVDAGLLAALAGTIRSGGVLVLGLPFSLQDGSSLAPGTRFERRLCRLLRELACSFPDTVRLPDSQPDVPPSLPPSLRPDHTVDLTHAGFEQDRLFRQACDHLDRHQLACITLTGRRGRGKSTLLARIAGWLQARHVSVAVTAARPSALQIVFQHGVNPDCYLAPPDALNADSRVLLIDEAANLPLRTLLDFREHYDQLVYSSTVEGYESAGRAFDLRFSQALEDSPHEVLALQPQSPWRWADADPLEQLVDTLLLAGPVSPSSRPASPVQGDVIRRLDRSLLAQDEGLLRAVFGLLRQNHYQTSSADLSHLLDAPGLQIWVLGNGSDIKAAVLLGQEGPVDEALWDEVLRRRRRLPHQLLPQLLAQCANDAGALRAVYWRILRIAVIATERRRGLGTRLLQHVEAQARLPDTATGAIGASFAGDDTSVAFWTANGYTSFHHGFRHNPRTGRSAVAVIKSWDPGVSEVAEQAVSIHADNQRWRGDAEWMSSATGRHEHCAFGSDAAPAPHTTHMDRELLVRFASGERSIHDTRAALGRLNRRHPLPVFDQKASTRRQHEKVLQECVRQVLQTSEVGMAMNRDGAGDGDGDIAGRIARPLAGQP